MTVMKKRKPYWNMFRETSKFSRRQQAKNSCFDVSAYRLCLLTSTCGAKIYQLLCTCHVVSAQETGGVAVHTSAGLYVPVGDSAGGIASRSSAVLPSCDSLNRAAKSGTDTYWCGASWFAQYCCTNAGRRVRVMIAQRGSLHLVQPTYVITLSREVTQKGFQIWRVTFGRGRPPGPCSR